MMLEKKATEFLEDLSSSAPFPGGGGAAAVTGALAASLGLMVANLTIGKKKYAAVEDEILEMKEKLTVLRDKLVVLTDKDAIGFEPLAKAYRLPKDTEEQRLEKERIMEKALYEACLVPGEIMETTLDVMKCLSVIGEKGTIMAVSDAVGGIVLAQAALESAALNIYINTKSMKNRELAQELNHRAEMLISEGNTRKFFLYKKNFGKLR